MQLKRLSIILGAILVLRLCTLGSPALIDTTEGRYASIAQEMLTSHNWLTPQIHLPAGLEAYQGKPPLHFWITATSLAILGNSEFAARLPSLVGMLFSLCGVWIFTKRFFNTRLAALASILYSSSALSLLLSGSVHLDFTLSAAVTWMVIGYWLFTYAENVSKLFGLIPFIAAAIGILTKGPIAIVLAAIVIIPSALVAREWRGLLRLPWIAGILVFLLIAAPWFYLQERASPGFIHYFFINENLLRYITKSYGDRYGEGHVAPYGSAIPMLLYGTLPWSLALLLLFRSDFWPRSRWPMHVVWWGFAPALFFSLSRQLLEAYMLPGYAGLAIFCAWLLQQAQLNPAFSLKLERLINWTITSIFSLNVLIVSTMAAVAIYLKFSPQAILPLWVTPNINSIAAAALILLSVLALSRKIKTIDCLELSAKSALAFSCLFFSLLVLEGDFASQKKSTGPIIDTIRSAQLDRNEIEIGVAFGKPFSAYFYDDANSNKPIKIVRVDPSLAEQNLPQNLIVLNKDLQNLSSALLQKYKVEQKLAFWSWLKLDPENIS